MLPSPPPLPRPLVVLVPLYIYPLEGAWEPLLQAAKAHPEVQFLAVINPGNGPGPTPRPDASYQSGLRRLQAAAANVSLLGYVHCTYGQRSVEVIEAEIETYARWAVESEDGDGVTVDGIFFDEVPTDEDSLAIINEVAQSTSRIWRSYRHQGRRDDAIRVFNPGVVPHPAYFDAAEYVVCFEQSEQHWNLDSSVRETLAAMQPAHRQKSIAIVHSCAGGQRADDGAVELVRQVRAQGFAGVYATHQMGGGFNTWPLSWERLCVEVAAVAGGLDHAPAEEIQIAE